MLEWSLVRIINNAGMVTGTLIVSGNERFVDKDIIKTLNIERKTLKKETGFTCFICPGCGSTTQIAQKSGSSGVHESKALEGYILAQRYAC